MEQKFFLTQVKRTTLGIYEKGVVVKDTLDAAKQSAHAYLGAYGYGNDASIIYTACFIMDMAGNVLFRDVDNRLPKPEPEPHPEEVTD